VNVSRT